MSEVPDFKCTCRIEQDGRPTEETRHSAVILLWQCPLCKAAPDLACYAHALTQRQDLKPDTFDTIMNIMKARIERLEEEIMEG